MPASESRTAMSTRKLVRPGMGCVMSISLLVVAACGGGTSKGEYVGDQHVASVAAELRADGKTAYYLGPEADGLALTSIDVVKENAPHFEVWAAYGTCRPEPFGEGGC